MSPRSIREGYNPPAVDPNRVRADLSRNENSPALSRAEIDAFELTARRLSQYPDSSQLRDALAERHGVEPDQVLVTAGGDEAIDRTVRVCLGGRGSDPRHLIAHHPTFEMFDVYASALGATVRGPVWFDGEFPLDEFVEAIDERVGLAALVSPNNPTGCAIPESTLQEAIRLCERRGVQVLVDLAYVEFADTDPTDWILENSQAVIIRSFSKAYGLAGMRLGYALSANTDLIQSMKNIAGPFPTGQASLDLGLAAIRHPERLQQIVQRTRTHRDVLIDILESCGVVTLPSQANFVLAKFDDANDFSEGSAAGDADSVENAPRVGTADEVREQLLARGVAVRAFPDKPLLNGCLRITVPRSRCELGLLAKALGVTKPISFLHSIPKQPMNRSTDTPAGGSSESVPSAQSQQPSPRSGQISRQTQETDVVCEVQLDQPAAPAVDTGLGFLDHMLTALALHSGIGLQLNCVGDRHVDDHHTVEDCALVLGSALDAALGDRQGIARYGWAIVPMDEALARVAIDLSGRPISQVQLDLQRSMLGEVATENLTHFFQSLAVTLRASVHVDVLRGENDHHRCEAAFKGLAKALAQAITLQNEKSVPSTKGVL